MTDPGSQPPLRQSPASQRCPEGQTTPQAPQLPMSEAVSTQRPPQAVRLPVHPARQRPISQRSKLIQAMPHMPQ